MASSGSRYYCKGTSATSIGATIYCQQQMHHTRDFKNKTFPYIKCSFTLCVDWMYFSLEEACRTCRSYLENWPDSKDMWRCLVETDARLGDTCPVEEVRITDL